MSNYTVADKTGGGTWTGAEHDQMKTAINVATTVNTQTASYTLALTDTNKYVQMNVATANNLAVPLNATVAFPTGTQIIIESIGVGQTTVVATGGVTINIPSGLTLRLRTAYSAAVLTKTATDTWDLAGDLESAIYLIKYLSSDATANSTTTGASITGVETTLDAGTYLITAWIRYVSGATTTGVKFGIDHSGTTTMFMAQLRYAGTGTTASSGAATMAAAGATGNVYEAFSTRTKGTLLGPTVSIDTTGDAMMILECMMIVSVSGTVKLMHASEVAASSTVKAATTLVIQKVN